MEHLKVNEITITVVKDFHPKPYGRYITDGPDCDKTSGEVFRDKHLAPALKTHDKVTVDLTGYNRYGRSFLDESFGGLIRQCGFTKAQLDEKLVYVHNDLTSVIAIIDERIQKAELKRIAG
ncbi:STAS-like domain-containing protein [Vibrio vulnificus]|nr:STAS-like domain-containing protein [Vibrio vulnificus]ELH9431086.1 STAS-like domain-containing protein [Vibrio vulnificus]ELI0347359.1 STAS-like domain-containing protein [Vibrio vulnificus]